jgi:hypothetical protein
VKNRRRAEFSLQMNLSNDREDDLPLNKTGGLAAADICASEAETCRLRKRTLLGIPAA